MVTPVRKQVFLLVITVITNVMHCMTTTVIMVQKSGRRPFKKSAFGGEKIAACGVHSLTPQGEGTEKLKPTIKLKVDDGEIAVLPFIICLF